MTMDQEILYNIGKAWLLLGKSETMITLAVVTFFTRHRTPFYRALLLLLASQFINGNLKLFFQVPLLPHLGEGFAFPSGHMQADAVFWGWLMYEYRSRWFTALGTTLLAGISCWLVYFNYHTPLDVIAAFPVSVCMLASLALILKKYPTASLESLSHGLLMVSIPLTIKMAPTLYYQNATLAQGLLMGFLAGSHCTDYRQQLYQGKQLLLAMVLALIGITCIGGMVYYVQVMLSLSLFSYNFLRTFIAIFWLSWGPYYILRRIRLQ